MKRLLKKVEKPISRLRRKITAEWQRVDINSPDLIQIITDSMAAGTQIQIEYEGSGWRLIQPYGWNTSKDGNVLLMCYKDTGEIRSYRLDRILQVLVDDSQLTNQPVDNTLDPTNLYEVRDYNANPEDFQIPELPNMDEILEISENEQGQELPFDQGLEYLRNDEIPEEIIDEQQNEEIPIDEEQKIEQNNDENKEKKEER